MSKKRRGNPPVRLELRELSLPEARRACIIKALRTCEGNVLDAADLLGVSEATVYRYITDHDITEDERYG